MKLLQKVLKIAPKGLYTLAYILCGHTIVLGQLTTQNRTAIDLVQNVLTGNGVQVSNIKYKGDTRALAYFNGSATTLGMKEGIILTTGTTLRTLFGPQGPNNNPSAGFDNGFDGYEPLSKLVGNKTTSNAAVLEFDFIPYSDTVRFNYIFASDEYPEFSGSDYNDVFAFFISGPGISGTKNMALLPNNVPVSINNINNGTTNSGPCVNCDYYVNNGKGTESPFNSNPKYIQYDGFTKNLSAVSKVQCGQTYHLIICISDVTDGLLDSGIFLEAKSLSSPAAITVSTTLEMTPYSDDPKMMPEGCVKAKVTISRSPKSSKEKLNIPIALSGSATVDVDYTTIPDYVLLNEGENSTSFTFNALSDGKNEGIENILLAFRVINGCGSEQNITEEIRIKDVDPIQLDLVGEKMYCPNTAVTLKAVVTGGLNKYSYLWNTTESSPTISVRPLFNTTYFVEVMDACSYEKKRDSFEVVIPILTPMELKPQADTSLICPYELLLKKAVVSGASGIYNYTWTNGGSILSQNENCAFKAEKTGVYYLSVKDLCGEIKKDTFKITVQNEPLETTIDTIFGCANIPGFLQTATIKGLQPYFYQWKHSGETTSGVSVTTKKTSTFEVEVSDACSTYSRTAVGNFILLQPEANFEVLSELTQVNLPVQFANKTIDATTFNWFFDDGQTSIVQHPSNTFINPGVYTVLLIATSEIGCVDSIRKPIEIEEEHWYYVPNSFTPDGNEYNAYFQPKGMNIGQASVTIYNRWGETVFRSEDPFFSWDGTNKGQDCMQGVYTYTIDYVTTKGRKKQLTGNVSLLR